LDSCLGDSSCCVGIILVPTSWYVTYLPVGTMSSVIFPQGVVRLDDLRKWFLLLIEIEIVKAELSYSDV
jgi:hypothetical protein